MTWFLVGAALTMMLLNVGLLVKMLVTLDDIQAAASAVAADLADVQAHARVIEAAPESPVGAAADFAAGGNDRPLPEAATGDDE